MEQQYQCSFLGLKQKDKQKKKGRNTTPMFLSLSNTERQKENKERINTISLIRTYRKKKKRKKYLC